MQEIRESRKLEKVQHEKKQEIGNVRNQKKKEVGKSRKSKKVGNWKKVGNKRNSRMSEKEGNQRRRF